jgi:hypothetical protein
MNSVHEMVPLIRLKLCKRVKRSAVIGGKFPRNDGLVKVKYFPSVVVVLVKQRSVFPSRMCFTGVPAVDTGYLVVEMAIQVAAIVYFGYAQQ